MLSWKCSVLWGKAVKNICWKDTSLKRPEYTTAYITKTRSVVLGYRAERDGAIEYTLTYCNIYPNCDVIILLDTYLFFLSGPPIGKLSSQEHVWISTSATAKTPISIQFVIWSVDGISIRLVTQVVNSLEAEIRYELLRKMNSAVLVVGFTDFFMSSGLWFCTVIIT